MTKTLAKQYTKIFSSFTDTEKRGKTRAPLSAHFQAEVKWGGAVLVLATPGLRIFLRILLLYYTKICFAFHHCPPSALCGKTWGGESNAFKTVAFSISWGKSTYSAVRTTCFKGSGSTHNITYTWLTLERNVDSFSRICLMFSNMNNLTI